ncbi:hypothetical protein [uncultured Propionibacterium sp.]|uniref:hypothetical protein n=1 Tax=uncultured Propionibacterium sp. TaxID=218066 RepID=UPI0029301961|nr:hypothetical protein [uncultured Propionibacterium sp.]
MQQEEHDDGRQDVMRRHVQIDLLRDLPGGTSLLKQSRQRVGRPAPVLRLHRL